MKLIQKPQTFTNQDGVQMTYYQTYIVINGTLIAVKPVFKKDKYLLNAIAEREDK